MMYTVHKNLGNIGNPTLLEHMRGWYKILPGEVLIETLPELINLPDKYHCGIGAPENPPEKCIWFDIETNWVKIYINGSWNLDADLPKFVIDFESELPIGVIQSESLPPDYWLVKASSQKEILDENISYTFEELMQEAVKHETSD